MWTQSRFKSGFWIAFCNTKNGAFWIVIRVESLIERKALSERDSLRVHFKNAAEAMHNTVEPLYNEVLGTMKITLLYQVSHYIRVKKQRNIKTWDQQNYLVIRGFCYIRPLYNEVPLYKCMGQSVHMDCAVGAKYYLGSWQCHVIGKAFIVQITIPITFQIAIWNFFRNVILAHVNTAIVRFGHENKSGENDKIMQFCVQNE